MEAINRIDTESSGSRILNFFKNLVKKNTTSVADESDQFKSFQAIGVSDFTPENVADHKDCLREIAIEGQAFLKLGINDGHTGIRPVHIDKIAKTAASVLHAKLFGIFSKKKVLADQKIVAEQEKITVLETKALQTNERREILEEHYQFNQKDYSRGLGIAYIIIAVFLVVADFPLSSLVAREVFELNGYQDELFGIGIAAMTVFIKIIYDQYLGLSIQAFLLRRRKEILLGKNYPDATDQEIKKARRIYNIQLGAKLVILIFLISTIVFVGLLRLENDVNMSNTAAMLKSNASGIVHNMGSWYKKLSFVGVTVAFPLIGGVCSSVGFKHINNLAARKRIRKEIKRLQEKIDLNHETKTEAEGKSREYGVLVDWLGPENRFVEELETYFLSSYHHGYQEGVHHNMPDDLFEAAQRSQSNYLIQQSVHLFTK